MDEVHGKEINLVRTTVKIPGLRPKGSRGISTNPSVMGPASMTTNGIFCALVLGIFYSLTALQPKFYYS